MRAKKLSNFDYIRYCLHGVILGGVVAGIGASLLGLDAAYPREIGGAAGAALVAVGFKFARWA